jgi:RNA polymerase subunit RPABC4/transcription elongation factor Spt4
MIYQNFNDIFRNIENIIAVIIAILFVTNYSINWYKKQNEEFKKFESIVFLSKEILKFNQVDSKTKNAIEKFFTKTILKFEKDYHNESQSSIFGYVYKFAQIDIYEIVTNATIENIKQASKNYEYFNEIYIYEQQKKAIEFDKYVDTAFLLKQKENQKWDSLYDNFGKVTGVTKEKIYEQMDEREKIEEEKKQKKWKFDEKNESENRTNLIYLQMTGKCPYCKSDMPKDARKCPSCTADLRKDYESIKADSGDIAYLRTVGKCPFCKDVIPKDARKCPSCTTNLY